MALILSNKQPTILVSDPKVVSVPATTSLSFVGNQPEIYDDIVEFVITGKQPTVFQSSINAAIRADLTLVGKQPNITVTKHVFVTVPVKSSLTLVGNQPSITATEHAFVTVPDATSLVLVGNQPSITVTKHAFVTVPATSSLSLVGKQPTLITERLFVVGKADITLTGKSPIFSWMDPASKADLVLTGKTPTILNGRTIYPLGNDLLLTNKLPIKKPQYSLQTGKASLTMVGKTPGVSTFLQTGKADLVLAGKTPTQGIVNEVITGKADLVLTGKQPLAAETPYCADGYGPIAPMEHPSGTVTGIADGKTGIISVWFRAQNESEVAVPLPPTVNILNISDTPGTGTVHFEANITSSLSTIDGGLRAVVSIIARNSAGTTILSAGGDTRPTPVETSLPGGWHHVLMSWDLAAGEFNLYFDDVDIDDAGWVGRTITDDTIPYTETRAVVFGNENYTSNTIAIVSDMYINTDEYLDFSTASNRREFTYFDTNGRLYGRNLLDDGSGPTGNQPMFFSSPNDPGDPENQSGYSNDWSLTALPTTYKDPSNDPCDSIAQTNGQTTWTAGLTPWDRALVLTGKQPFQFVTKNIVPGKADLVFNNFGPTKLTRTPGKADLVLTGKAGDANIADRVIYPGRADLLLVNKQPAERKNFGKADFVLDNKTPHAFLTWLNKTGGNSFVLHNKCPFIKVWQPQPENIPCTWGEQSEDVCTWTEQSEQSNTWKTQETSDT